MTDQRWTPERAYEWLEELQRRGMLLGLERVVRLAGLLDDPQESFPSVLIAGTNGKGSVAAMIDAVLARSGIRTGRYTSPHLIEWTERITVESTPIAAQEFADALQVVSEGADEVEATPFEALTMAAFHHFRECGIERGVVEVGLGGRLDATRICRADYTIVTAIDRDHTTELGEDLNTIAREKGAIARAGAPMLLGPGTESVRPALEEQAKEIGAQVYRAVDLARVEGVPDDAWGLRGEAELTGLPVLDFHLPLAGDHMAANLTTALAVIGLMRESDPRITADTIAEGIKRVEWPGRLHAVPTPPGSPELLLDVGHTPAAAELVVREIERRRPGRRLHVVVALATDKDLDRFLHHLVPGASRLVATTWEGPRAAEPRRIADSAGVIATEGGRSPAIEVEHDPMTALRQAALGLGEKGVVLAIGSHRLVGTILRALEEGERVYQEGE